MQSTNFLRITLFGQKKDLLEISREIVNEKCYVAS